MNMDTRMTTVILMIIPRAIATITVIHTLIRTITTTAMVSAWAITTIPLIRRM